MRRIAVLVAVVLVLWHVTGVRGDDAPTTHDLTMVLSVHGTDQTLRTVGTSGCDSPYVQIGAPVFVLDESGATITVVPLPVGTMTNFNPYARICQFSISVHKLPDAVSYHVVLGPYEVTDIFPAYLDQHNWQLVFDFS